MAEVMDDISAVPASGERCKRGTAARRVSLGLYVPVWPPESVANGIVTYAATVVPEFGAFGVDAHLIAMRHRGEAPEDSRVRIVRPFARRGGWLRFYLNRFRLSFGGTPAIAAYQGRALAADIESWCEQQPLDLIEIPDSLGLGDWVARRVDRPVVIRLHGPWFLNGPALGVAEDASFHRRLYREGKALERAAAVNAPSEDVLRATREHYGLALDNASVIPNPVAPCDPALRWSRADCEQDVILFVGRFDRHKGGDLVIDAFSRIAARRPEVRLVFVGPDRGLLGPDGRSTPIGGYLDARLDESTRQRVTWLGPQPPQRVRQLRRTAGVTVVASRYEVFGITVTEAMAAGCPLVATATGGIPEIVEHEVNGLLARPGDAEDLAAQVDRLMGDARLGVRLGERARVDCERRYAPRVVAERLGESYRAIIG